MKDTTAALMNSLLQEVVNGGTGYEGRISGMHVAGKTGTTNNDQDRYFVGYTPYYSCAVWVGYVHNQRIVASGNPAASMWQKVMSRVHEGAGGQGLLQLLRPDLREGLCRQRPAGHRGLRLDCRGSRVYSALVAADNAPSASCNLHTSPDYTVAFEDENGETTMASGSILNYERQRLPGYEDLEAEDDFMLLYGGTSGGDDDWGGFFGGSDDDEDDDDVHTSWWGIKHKQHEKRARSRGGRALCTFAGKKIKCRSPFSNAAAYVIIEQTFHSEGGEGMADRVIFHCDLNCFFASVELLDKPALREVPVAVCGDPASRHGIILAKNEPAKRRGVQTAETCGRPGRSART